MSIFGSQINYCSILFANFYLYVLCIRAQQWNGSQQHSTTACSCKIISRRLKILFLSCVTNGLSFKRHRAVHGEFFCLDGFHQLLLEWCLLNVTDSMTGFAFKLGVARISQLRTFCIIHLQEVLVSLNGDEIFESNRNRTVAFHCFLQCRVTWFPHLERFLRRHGESLHSSDISCWVGILYYVRVRRGQHFIVYILFPDQLAA